MFKDKPVISNQHGALIMALIPFLYALCVYGPTLEQVLLGVAWLFLYFFSSPFLSLFSKKPTERNKKWASIYFVLSILTALPAIFAKPWILQFLCVMIPLAGVQVYYAKQHDERNLNNDIAGILTFGVIGMATSYLVTNQYNFEILIHPTIYFIATTFYVKSIGRERRNPFYMEFSIASHMMLAMIYVTMGDNWMFAAYLIGLFRAAVVTSFGLNVKQVGLLEFPVVIFLLIALVYR